jgi:hypothetical protein
MAEFVGRIDSFKVKGAEVTLTLKGPARVGLLEDLVELSFRESVKVSMTDPQVRLAVVEGGDGHVYPASAPDGRPLSGDSADADPAPATAAHRGRGRGRAKSEPVF